MFEVCVKHVWECAVCAQPQAVEQVKDRETESE